MGYTHYWRFSQNPKNIENGADKFKRAVELTKKAISMLPEEVDVSHYSYDENTKELKRTTKKIKLELGNGAGKDEPVFKDSQIIFNGKGEHAYETFAMELDDPSYEFNFCKTAEMPYDSAVCVALLCFKKCFGDDINVTSDGDMSGNDEVGWAVAREIMGKIERLKE